MPSGPDQSRDLQPVSETSSIKSPLSPTKHRIAHIAASVAAKLGLHRQTSSPTTENATPVAPVTEETPSQVDEFGFVKTDRGLELTPEHQKISDEMRDPSKLAPLVKSFFDSGEADNAAYAIKSFLLSNQFKKPETKAALKEYAKVIADMPDSLSSHAELQEAMKRVEDELKARYAHIDIAVPSGDIVEILSAVEILHLSNPLREDLPRADSLLKLATRLDTNEHNRPFNSFYDRGDRRSAWAQSLVAETLARIGKVEDAITALRSIDPQFVQKDFADVRNAVNVISGFIGGDSVLQKQLEEFTGRDDIVELYSEAGTSPHTV